MKKPGFHPAPRAFTLVELLIVVTIIGILATIVIPQFNNASSQARRESILAQLKTVRTQIDVYKIQHDGQLPDLITDWTALTSSSIHGGKAVGPYLAKAPLNVLNNLNNVEDGDGTVPLGQCGFIYDYAGGSGTGNILATDETASVVFDEQAN